MMKRLLRRIVGAAVSRGFFPHIIEGGLVRNINYIQSIAHDCTFGGYHDISLCRVIDADAFFVLNCVNLDCSSPEVRIFRGFNDSVGVKLCDAPMNFQLGSRCQFFDMEDERLIFSNSIINDCLGSKIWTYDGEKPKVKHTRDRPYFSVNGIATLGAGLDFNLLYKRRPGYGYPTQQESQFRKRLFIDYLTTGETKWSFSYDEIVQELGINGSIYVNHLLFSPTGKYLFGLAIIPPSRDCIARRCYPFLINLEDGQIFRILKDLEFVSHHCFIDDYSMIIFAGPEPRSGAYHYVNILSNSVLRIGLPNVDGHPSINDGRFVTDSYPAPSGYQSLWTGRNGETNKIADFFSWELSDHSMRCDLHPRVVSGSVVMVDVMTDRRGSRRVGVLNILD